MIGWINLSVKAFIIDVFGADVWTKILAESGEEESWVSSCPYSDAVTYNLVLTGAKILGVTAGQALEAYGQYFVKYVKAQVRALARLRGREGAATAAGAAAAARPPAASASATRPPAAAGAAAGERFAAPRARACPVPAPPRRLRRLCLQGYTKLLKCLGSNLAEFLQNLNDLHLHLSMSYTAMKAPAFRCENVGGRRCLPSGARRTWRSWRCAAAG
jgi:hypothetical protein